MIGAAAVIGAWYAPQLAGDASAARLCAMVDQPLSLCLAPTLADLGADARRGLDRLARDGFRAVQLSAGQPGLRPRELDQSARRDLVATLRRRELSAAGLDLWIPAEHFIDAATADRAVTVAVATIELAGDLGRLPVSLTLPGDEGAGVEVIDALVARATARGVPLADHARPGCGRDTVGLGVDPVAWLVDGDDPALLGASTGRRLVSARLADLSADGLRRPPGAPGGRLDVTAYRVALTVAGYGRPVVLDLRQWADPMVGLGPARAVWADASP